MAADYTQIATQKIKDDAYFSGASTVQLALADTTGFSTPPTAAEIKAGLLADANGYTKQTVSVSSGVVAGTACTYTFGSATISPSGGNVTYGAVAILIDGEPLVTRVHDTNRVLADGSSYTFENITYVINV